MDKVVTDRVVVVVVVVVVDTGAVGMGGMVARRGGENQEGTVGVGVGVGVAATTGVGAGPGTATAGTGRLHTGGAMARRAALGVGLETEVGVEAEVEEVEVGVKVDAAVEAAASVAGEGECAGAGNERVMAGTTHGGTQEDTDASRGVHPGEGGPGVVMAVVWSCLTVSGVAHEHTDRGVKEASAAAPAGERPGVDRGRLVHVVGTGTAVVVLAEVTVPRPVIAGVQGPQLGDAAGSRVASEYYVGMLLAFAHLHQGAHTRAAPCVVRFTPCCIVQVGLVLVLRRVFHSVIWYIQRKLWLLGARVLWCLLLGETKQKRN